MSYALQVISKPATVVATPIHDGTNGQGHPYRVVEFIIETGNASVFFGDENVTGDADGMEVDKDNQYDFEAPLSRGTPSSWDLRKIYYVGGAFKLIIVKEVSNQ